MSVEQVDAGKSGLSDIEIPDDPGKPIHTRDYDVAVYEFGPGRILLRGRIHDQRPYGLTPDDDRPVSVHDMTVDMVVEIPSYQILYCRAHITAFPNDPCPDIEDRYRQLEGLSIVRGFTHKVRELLGGPNGCAHVTALIQAMAPVAIQGGFSVQWGNAGKLLGSTDITPEMEKQFWQMSLMANRNTCHFFADDGPAVKAFEEGRQWRPPKWALERAVELGLSEDELHSIWQNRRKARAEGKTG